jgi:glutamate synthase (NADPH/NADH) small chain
MGKVTGFLEIDRRDRKYLPASDRIRNYREFVIPLGEEGTRDQAARCMDCGIPFCHSGCPVNNQIPDWNDLVYHGEWEEALRNLQSTNNFPEVTGRICPAPCEASCTLNLEDTPVTIKTIESAIADRGWQEGWIVPEPPTVKTGKRVAVVGSGPAGMAAAQQLARAGHEVHVFEKHGRAGGLMRYGIPDFKMEKHHVDRRVKQMEAEGVTFHYDVHVGSGTPVSDLVDEFDAVLLAGGAEKPRDLPVEGRDLDGIHFAMDFLPQQNRRVSGENAGNTKPILASGKHVVVIGGGDTWIRLHRHLDPAGRPVREAVRDHACSAGARGQARDLAELAAEAAHLLKSGRGRRARIRRDDDPFRRSGWQGCPTARASSRRDL